MYVNGNNLRGLQDGLTPFIISIFYEQQALDDRSIPLSNLQHNFTNDRFWIDVNGKRLYSRLFSEVLPLDKMYPGKFTAYQINNPYPDPGHHEADIVPAYLRSDGIVLILATGSEYPDFTRYQFLKVDCEHNYLANEIRSGAKNPNLPYVNLSYPAGANYNLSGTGCIINLKESLLACNGTTAPPKDPTSPCNYKEVTTTKKLFFVKDRQTNNDIQVQVPVKKKVCKDIPGNVTYTVPCSTEIDKLNQQLNNQ